MREPVEIRIKISSKDVMLYRFNIVESIYTQFRNYRGFQQKIYLAEKVLVEQNLITSKMKMRDVTRIYYESGMFQPFGFTTMPVTSSDFYLIILVGTREVELNASKPSDDGYTKLKAKNEILLLFQNTPKAKLKSLYRTLAIQYHPDKPDGSEDMMKYLNDLKDKYIK